MNGLRYLLACVVVFAASCSYAELFKFDCEEGKAKARARGQDARLFGIWYPAIDRVHVEAGNTKNIPMRKYSPGGYCISGRLSELSDIGKDVWFTEGDKISFGYCNTGSFYIYRTYRYRVQGDSLWYYYLNEKTDSARAEGVLCLRFKQ